MLQHIGSIDVCRAPFVSMLVIKVPHDIECKVRRHEIEMWCDRRRPLQRNDADDVLSITMLRSGGRANEDVRRGGGHIVARDRLDRAALYPTWFCLSYGRGMGWLPRLLVSAGWTAWLLLIIY